MTHQTNAFISCWKEELTTFGISPSLSGCPRSNLIFHFCWFSPNNWCASWYQIMYDGGSKAPRTTQCKTTVLPAFTYRSGSPINSVLGTINKVKHKEFIRIFLYAWTILNNIFQLHFWNFNKIYSINVVWLVIAKIFHDDKKNSMTEKLCKKFTLRSLKYHRIINDNYVVCKSVLMKFLWKYHYLRKHILAWMI